MERNYEIIFESHFNAYGDWFVEIFDCEGNRVYCLQVSYQELKKWVNSDKYRVITESDTHILPALTAFYHGNYDQQIELLRIYLKENDLIPVEYL